MITHSPGPWHHKITDEGDLIVVIPPHEQFCAVLGFGDMENTDGEDHANARLIAAAPDLLAACEAVLADEDCDLYSTAIAQIRAAVARATIGWGA